MKRVALPLILLLAISLSWTARPAHAEDDNRRALAESLLNAMNVRQTVEKSFDIVKQMIPQQMERMGNAMGQTPDPDAAEHTSKMLDAIAEEISWDHIKDDYIGLYADTFTAEEMQGMIDFYQSEPGQALVSKQPILMQKSMQLNQQMMMRIMPKLQEFMRPTTMRPPMAPSDVPDAPAPAIEADDAEQPAASTPDEP
jgi:hypothetical protein